jgi:hypothetical protein
MNNTPFELYTTEKNNHVVHWPSFKNIKEADTGLKLLDILFGEVKCFEVGLGILLHGGDLDTLWLDFTVWVQGNKHDYSEYLMDMYEIRCVVFRNKHEAEQFQDILEKKYIWKTLKA